MSVWNMSGHESGAYFGRRPRKKRSLLRVIFGALATLGAMAGVASVLLDPPEFVVQQAANPVPIRQGWVAIVKPFQLYALPSPIFGNDPRQFAARRYTGPGGGRIDTLTYGVAEPGLGPWLQVEIRRFGNENEPEIPQYSELARLAARSGSSIAKSSLPGLVETRFGGAEITSLQLSTGERFTACLGFRIPRQEPGVGISGIACGTPARPLDSQTLACTIGRLDLVASGEDKEIGTFFARSELQRGKECSVARSAQASEKVQDKSGWLSPATSALPLKGTLAQAETRRR